MAQEASQRNRGRFANAGGLIMFSEAQVLPKTDGRTSICIVSRVRAADDGAMARLMISTV